ncbi:MAG: hypothetical protein RL154_527 [Pseudomonadota bacterium]|jgi:ferredoxin
MNKITFKGFGEEKVVEAATGDILLRVAYANGVKLPKDCEDGECGSCAVAIDYAKEYTEYMDSQGKELVTLIGKAAYSMQEAKDLEQAGLPGKVRLACQCIVRCDITVKPFLG